MLTKIDVNHFQDKIEWLWNHVKTQSYAFDDTVKGNSQAFLISLFRPNSEHYYNDSGMVSVTDIQPCINANVHFLLWDTTTYPIVELLREGRELFQHVFAKHSLARITGTIPSPNKKAVRVATLLGMKFEGCMRECFLHDKRYYDLFIYGVLRREFEAVKTPLVKEPSLGRTN